MPRFSRNDIMSLVGQKPRHELGESYGPSLRLSELLSSPDVALLDELELDYGSVEGDPLLRGAIAERHGVHPDDVVVTVGSAHALFLCAFILCNPGDETLTTAPGFPPARAALSAVGADVNVLPVSFDRAYRLDTSEFRERLSARSRLVSIASPQNPSGVVVSQEILREMLALMSEICPAAYLLVDETYREASYGDDRIAETACALSPKVISIASLSKCHGAPGLRIGWAITRDPTMREQLVLAKFNSVIACSPLTEALALKVFEQRDRIMDERRAHLDAGLRCTASWVRQNSRYVEWIRPDAGAICCVRLKAAAFDDAAVQRFYAELALIGARVASGTWFGDEARVFRLGFGLLATPDLEAALGAVTSALGQSTRAVLSASHPSRRRQA